MTHPGTPSNPFEKATRFANAATVFVERRQQLLKSFQKSGNLIGGFVFKFLKVERELYQFLPFNGPEIRSS
jgi:hypothetical protein